MTNGEPLARCAGAGRTYGAGPTATVALQPTDCEVRERARIAVIVVTHDASVAARADREIALRDGEVQA